MECGTQTRLAWIRGGSPQVIGARAAGLTRSAFYVRRIGSVEFLIQPNGEGTGSETTSRMVQGHAAVR